VKFKVYVDYAKEPDPQIPFLHRKVLDRARDFKRNDLHDSIVHR
jgi:hypothetical protein